MQHVKTRQQATSAQHLSARRPSLGPGRLFAHWPEGFRRVVVFCLVSNLGVAAFDKFLSPFLRDSGVPVVSIGYFRAVASTAGALTAAAAGVLADRFGRRAVVVVGRALRLLSWAAIVLLPQQRWLVPIACVWGLASAAGGAFIALTAESAPDGRRATGFAITGAVEALAALVVPATIGLLADRLGLRTALGCVLVPGLVAVYLGTRLRETAGRVGGRGENGGAGEPGEADAVASPATAGLRFMFSSAGLGARLMALIWMITGFEMGLMGPVWALYVTDRFGVSYAGLGVVSTVSALGAIFGQMVGGRTADRVGYAGLMMVCLASTSLLYALVPAAAAPSQFTVICCATNFTAYLAAPCWGAVGASATPRRVRGAVLGLYQSLMWAGTALGNAVSGYVYLVGITVPFYLFAGAELVMMLLALAGLRAGLSGFSPKAVHDD